MVKIIGTTVLLRSPARYDNGVRKVLAMMTEETTVQMKERILSGKDPVLTIAISQDFKVVCDTCKIFEGLAIWVVKHYFNDPVESVIKACVELQAETAKAQEACLTLQPAIVNYFVKRYETDDNIVTVDADI